VSSSAREKLLSLKCGIVLATVLALAGCLCTKPDCQLAITTPKDGATLPPGDVGVTFNPMRGDFCTFPPKGYEVSLDGGTAQWVAQGQSAAATFRDVRPGDHVAKVVAIAKHGRPVGEASAKFRILAPPTPTPTPTPIPPAPTPVPVAVVPPPPPPPAPEPVRDDTSLADMFFDTNKWDIRADQTATMDANIQWLKAHPNAEVTIEGYCDKRGSKKWNMTLIKNRADAARAYLIQNGIEGSRIKDEGVFEPTRFGTGENSVAWQKNRRAHFVVRQR
jgi:peptidoglycan-associated lipoprotein